MLQQILQGCEGVQNILDDIIIHAATQKELDEGLQKVLTLLQERGGESGGAKVLGKLPVPGRPTIWIIVGQGPTALAVGAGGGCLDIFSLVYPFFPLSPSPWETARYRLKYCRKGPLNPKPTNQPKSFRKKGITLNRDKCQFNMLKLEFMGHVLSEHGVGLTEAKVNAVVNAREPTSASEVRSYFCFVQYNARFINDLAKISAPLRQLTHKNAIFKWGHA